MAEFKRVGMNDEGICGIKGDGRWRAMIIW
jgi:hypothetical protein